MPVPTLITELSTTAGSNSPAGSESPVDGDNYLRAHGAFIAQLNANKLDKAGTVTPTADQPMGTYKHTGAGSATASGQYLTWGQLLPASAGSVSAPSLTFSGDLNTGLWNATTDAVGVAVGGAECARFTSSGLQISSGWLDLPTARGLGYLASSDRTTILGVSIPNFGIGIGSLSGLGLGMAISGYSGIVMVTTETERLRIDGSGNTLLYPQTAAPTLTVNGQMVFNLTSDTNLRISVRGSDGVTRVANITLA